MVYKYHEEGFEARNLGRWVELTVDEAKSEIRNWCGGRWCQEAQFKAEAAKWMGMGECHLQ